jgi:hypothetical protein
MTIHAFIQLVEGAKQTPRGWQVRCPSHDDRDPSLSVREGDRGLLLKCWAGCSAEDITRTLGLKLSDLFFDSNHRDSSERRNVIQQRAKERAARQAIEEANGRHMDALREADCLVRTAQGLSIATWTDDELATAVDTVGRAWQLLEAEGLQHA